MTNHHVIDATVYQMLKDAADAKAFCPTNAEIAAKLGASRPAALRSVARLEESAMIVVTRIGRASRTVTIAATGAQTMETNPDKIARRTEDTKTQVAERKERLADLVADGLSIEQAAREIGTSANTARKAWKEIVSGLGWQAA